MAMFPTNCHTSPNKANPGHRGGPGWRRAGGNFVRRLPGSENSCIIGAGEGTREGGDMAWQPVGAPKNIRYQRPIFTGRVCRLSITFNSLVDYLWAEVRIFGVFAHHFRVSLPNFDAELNAR